MDDDGNIGEQPTKKPAGPELLQYATTNCMNITATDPCDKAFQFQKCFTGYFRTKDANVLRNCEEFE